MATFEIIEARRHHCGKMARMLRAEHQRSGMRLGLDSHTELRRCYDASSGYRKAWTIDGKLAALGGVMGTMLSPVGFIWVAFTDHATRYPLEIVREARRQLDHIMTWKFEVHTTVLSDDEAAKRFAVFLGFHVADEGEGAPAFTRYGRKRLAAYLDSDAPRVQLNGGSFIPMGYHAEAR